jgi:hypothetical protein
MLFPGWNARARFPERIRVSKVQKNTHLVVDHMLPGFLCAARSCLSVIAKRAQS